MRLELVPRGGKNRHPVLSVRRRRFRAEVRRIGGSDVPRDHLVGEGHFEEPYRIVEAL